MSREKLEALDRLQDVDLQIEELTKQADAFPARVAALTAEIAKARSTADAERGRLADNERARHSAENSIAEEKERIKKWESRLPALKQAREFAALEREINGAKKAYEATEFTLLELNEAAAPLLASLRQKEAEVAQREGALAKEAGDIQHNEKALRGQISELQSQREKVRSGVDPKIYSTYEQIRKRKGGRVLVPIARDACTGCNRKLLPRVINSVLNGNVESCPACMRLLTAPPPPPDPALA